ncbi:superoxide dismutase family protein [Paracoccus sp. S3-43]|uniref:superoxide dismutase family protein n=1 Tax=Paracoccus sp. S3-43 TaxID=3030011 RepID=UPI0023B01D03|nr:superoxide dismutase family protein [Paracoccus sp. S3-43]WEF22910.1 superoxide dismutase family protein [Paracoccus sp. S3-43]
MPFRTAAALGLLLALPAAAQDAPAPAPTPAPTEGEAPMIAEIKTAEGQSLGTATAVATPSGLMLVTLELQGVPAGIRAVHVHETGKCSPPDFESAGGHIAGNKEHGVMAANGPHPGDLPNIHIPESGALTVEYFVAGLTTDLMADEDGSAIIIHEHPDDYVSQPTGNAGGRIGCGTFAQAN